MIKRITPIIIIFLFMGFATTTPAADELPLVTAEWPPYTSSSIDGKGFIAEFVSEVVREMGMVPDIKFYPWSRTQKIIESGNVFGGFPFGITSERKELFNYSDIFLKTNAKFFYKKDRLGAIKGDETIKELKSFTVGVIRKSKTLSKLKAAGFTRIYTLDSAEQAIQMLHLGRIQLAALVEHSGWYYLQKLFPGESGKWGAIQFYKMEAALLISRSFPDADHLTATFNQAILTVKQRGTYDKLLKKYGLPVQ